MMTKNLLISRPEISSSSLGARQKMMERRRKVKVRFTCKTAIDHEIAIYVDDDDK